MGVAAAGGVVVLVLADLLLAGASAGVHDLFAVGVRIAVYALAAFAAATAAATFGWWREPIGRPWTLFFVEYALLLVNYIIRRTAPDATTALAVTLIIVNLAQIAAYYLASRLLDSAGLGYLISTRRRIVLTIAALALALLISQSSLVELWRTIGTSAFSASSLIALLSDIITFTLIAPLAMSTVALRGGQVFWIFCFLTISVFGWMFNEIGGTIATALGGGDGAVRTARLAGLVIASLFNAAAATTQWSAARRAMRGSVADA